MTTGIILAVLLAAICAKFIIKRRMKGRKSKTINIIHKILGFLFPVVLIYHLISVFPLRYQRPVIMYILGFIMLLMSVISIVTYFLRKTLSKKWILFHRLSAIVIILCLLGHIAAGLISFSDYKSKIASIQITDIDISEVPDGEYTGSYDAGYIYVEAKVTVKSGRLTDVKLLKHRNERGKKAEAITEEMISNQKNRVDAVSGATNSSNVIMKAVANALKSAN